MERRRNWKKMNSVKMKRWRAWLWFKESLIVPTKCILLKLSSRSRRKAKGKEFYRYFLSFFTFFSLFYNKVKMAGNGHGLVSLYKDMESYGEYADIRVMWEIIHSCPEGTPKRKERRKKSSYWRFCFQPR